MRQLYLPVLLAALAGCSDVVTERFTDLNEARAKRAFERGWLPPLMPVSAKKIVLKSDVDSNTAQCAFDYAAAERGDYINRLEKAEATLTWEADACVLTLTTNGCRWVIRLPDREARGEFRMTLQQQWPP